MHDLPTQEDRSVAEAFDEMIEWLKKVPGFEDQMTLGEGFAMAPKGHPSLECASRVFKCTSCGGLGPITRIQIVLWSHEDEDGAEDDSGIHYCCPYCMSPSTVMWKPAVSGHA